MASVARLPSIGLKLSLLMMQCIHYFPVRRLTGKNVSGRVAWRSHKEIAGLSTSACPKDRGAAIEGNWNWSLMASRMESHSPHHEFRPAEQSGQFSLLPIH